MTTALHGLIHWIMGSITGSGIVGVANLFVGVGLAVYALVRKFRRVKTWSFNLSGNDGGIRMQLEISTPPLTLKRSKEIELKTRSGRK